MEIKDHIYNNEGQATVEYILLLAVVVVIIFTFMGQIRQRLIGETFPCPVTDKSLGCVVTRSLSSFGTGPNYRYFTLRR